MLCAPRAEQRGVRAAADNVPEECAGHVAGNVQLCVRALVRARAPPLGLGFRLMLVWSAFADVELLHLGCMSAERA